MRTLLIFTLACVLGGATPPAPADYRKSVDAWHAGRVAKLGAEDGWLTLIGRDWLKPGENTLGSAPGSTVLLPTWAAPAQAGVFNLEGTTVRFRAFPGCGILLNGQPVTEAVLKTDADGVPDILLAGRVRFHVIRRGAQFAVRLKDPENPARKAFHGVPRFPVNPAWRIEAEFLPYGTPKQRAVPTVLGTTELMTAPGLLRFKVGRRTVTLEPMQEGGADAELFLIFNDRTNGRGSYGAGRFLYADFPKHGKVILDFNRAINPPCAFTIFATCPLPPEQNRLAFEIKAGEKDPGLH
jgi:hypothetical protein